jgi:dTDP-glucose 4,6-dehydratase
MRLFWRPRCAVVHFAAESLVDQSIYEPSPVRQTSPVPFVLLEVARKPSISHFLHISTDEVYRDFTPDTFADENAQLQPSSPYSAPKAGADLLVRSCCARRGERLSYYDKY